MYELVVYTDVNASGTAVLLEAMVERIKPRPFSRLLVASNIERLRRRPLSFRQILPRLPMP